MVSDQFKETLATTELAIQVGSAIVANLLNPGSGSGYRDPVIEHKVASSLRKQLAKNLKPVSE